MTDRCPVLAALPACKYNDRLQVPSGVMTNPKWTYQQFVTFEEQAAAIYLQMASRFSPEEPELALFWLDMAMQEKQHAGLLQFCIAEELFATVLPSDKEIRGTAALFDSLLRRAGNPDLTVAEAFRIATEMELSEVNAIYDRLTTPVHASTYLLRRKIATSLQDHVGELHRQACKSNVPEDVLKELERAASKRPAT